MIFFLQLRGEIVFLSPLFFSLLIQTDERNLYPPSSFPFFPISILSLVLLFNKNKTDLKHSVKLIKHELSGGTCFLYWQPLYHEEGESPSSKGNL